LQCNWKLHYLYIHNSITIIK